MDERPTLEIIAPTVEEAISQGLEQLGLTAADVSVEVLDAGSKGLFGMGGRQVRVRLTVHDPLLDQTESVVSKLLHKMGLEAQVAAHYDESDKPDRRSIRVDVEGYRARREKQLRQMAQRMADQALKMGRRVALEPMSAAERRIVHMELQGHPAVLTESTGEEPRRKVTIVPKE